MKKLFLFSLFVSLTIPVWACADARLFKIFPIGIYNDTIVSIDIDINRITNIFAVDEPANGLPESGVVCCIKSYITKYDEHQFPFEVVLTDSVLIDNTKTELELKNIYEKTYMKILKDIPEIKLFQTNSISFGNFKYKHKDIEIKDNQLFYKKKLYPIEILKDTTYYGFDPNNYFGYDYIPPIGSVRKYVSDSMELVVIHTIRRKKMDAKITKTQIRQCVQRHLYGADFASW